MIVLRLKHALEKSVTCGQNPFLTYKDFAIKYGFDSVYVPSWAKRNTLDAVGVALKNDPKVGIDLTFILRNGRTEFPSVIDGRRSKPPDQRQKNRARDVADDIIKQYRLTVPNPYLR